MNTQVRAESGLLKVQASSTGFVFIAAVFAAVGGLLFGYDTGVISGALLFIKSQFHLSVFHQELVVSVVLIGATAGALSTSSSRNRPRELDRPTSTSARSMASPRR